jgi:hypothetical protein
MLQEYLVLSGDADSTTNVDTGIKPFVPLFVGQCILVKGIQGAFLFVYGGVGVLVLGLGEDSLSMSLNRMSGSYDTLARFQSVSCFIFLSKRTCMH